MNKNNHPDNLITRTEHLRSIVGELSEVHSLLTVLCSQIEGGGIVLALVSHQQRRVGRLRGLADEDLLEQRGCNLAASAGAVAVVRELDVLAHGVSCRPIAAPS